jgi:hypothetical protein
MLQRYCEISATDRGQLVITFREHGKIYGQFVSEPAPFHPAIEESYAERGPFGARSGAIKRLRVVS